MRLYQFVTWFTQSSCMTVLLVLTMYTPSAMYTKSACIIIHGTWAKDTTWYRPSGDFFEAIKQCNDEYNYVDEVIAFTWSGKLGYPAQLQAAYELVAVMNSYHSVILIAHSHGSTVGMIASEILMEKVSNGDSFAKIDKFYSLGVPVQPASISPNMSVIRKFYNLFSFSDLIQTVNGVYERVFEQQDCIFNLSVELCGNQPGHSELHDAIIAKHLLHIDECFEQFICAPGKISFAADSAPLYAVQEDQKQLIELDKKAHALSVLAFFRASQLSHDHFGYVDCEDL